MTPQERDLITTLLTRLKSAAGQPKEPEAEAQIRQAMAEQPDAPYYLVQTVLIQDLSLHQAQNRITELEHQLADAQAKAAKPTTFLGRLIGSSQPAANSPAPVPSTGPWTRGLQVTGPQAGYAQPGSTQPGYAPEPGYAQGGAGMFGGSGGFLRSAAATAAGVAGGALLFEGISSLFGHSYANTVGGGFGGMGTPGLGETVINNHYGEGGSGSGSGDYGGGGEDSASGGNYGGGGDYGAGGGDADAAGSDFGGGGDSSSC